MILVHTVFAILLSHNWNQFMNRSIKLRSNCQSKTFCSITFYSARQEWKWCNFVTQRALRIYFLFKENENEEENLFCFVSTFHSTFFKGYLIKTFVLQKTVMTRYDEKLTKNMLKLQGKLWFPELGFRNFVEFSPGPKYNHYWKL
jgi:hypothetical protein